jgi:SAM-dependent methyltransferase
MTFFRSLGLEPVAWALRRLHCPVPPSALVLEVGSGGNPYARANVLLDGYEDTRQRHWAPLVADRPTVLGFAERLPFRDKAFDFVIASHVLEHSTQPERFLCELQRVARAGYIEVPDAFMERINPYRDHRLEITVRDGRLVIRKKRGWIEDPAVVELYEHDAKPIVTQHLIPRHPFAFHVRYYWRDKIDFIVVNPEDDAAWPAPESAPRQPGPATLRGVIGGALLHVARRMLSQRKRNASLSLAPLLACPDCRGTAMTLATEEVRCGGCGRSYPILRGVPRLYPEGQS